MSVAYRSTRDVVTVSGPDAENYLHSQLSQEISGMAVGASAASLVLEPTGRVDALVRVTRVAAEVFELDIDRGYGEQLLVRLKRFKIRVKAELELTTRDCISVRGDDIESLSGDSRPAWWMNGQAFDVFEIDDILGTRMISDGDAEALRIAAGWPAMGREVTAESLPAELGVIDLAVSFKKGCYPGQELVERMDSRGAQAPRTLCIVPANTPAEGIEITSKAGDKALAFVKRGTDLASINAVPVGTHNL